MEVFSHVWPRRVLYCDLDNLLLGNVDALAAVDLPFVCMHDWKVPGILNSSLMSWSGDWRWLYEEFADSPSRWAEQYANLPKVGDQAFIEDRLAERKIRPTIWKDVLPRNYFVPPEAIFPPYRRLVDETRVVAWAGKPKLWQFENLTRAFRAWL